MPVTSAASAIKAGTVAHFAASSAPAGWIKANGAAISRATYAALFLTIGTTYGAGDGSTTFNIPDLRGEFLRSWDDSRGIDSARAIGSLQLDAMQGHRHGYQAAGGGGSSGGDYLKNVSGTTTQGTDALGYPITDGTNGTPRTGAETRPRNIALLACIKY